MPKRGRLIVFLGPVGVGKSTVIKGLANELRARGFRVSTTFIKAFHGPSYLLWRFVIRLLGLRTGWLAPWYVIPRSSRLKLTKMLMNFTMYMDALFVIPLKLLHIYVLKILDFYVLSEEYLSSTIFDYLYACINLGIKCKIPIRVVYSLSIKYTPDKSIIILSNYQELVRRWKLRGYGDPQPVYVKLLEFFLLKFGHEFYKNIFIIDTSNLKISEAINKIFYKVLAS